jgi:2-C-methyl-D-erythritol 4-phosphate cytidylyltransferase/2-C-methyl-D-erythritol 2,4-cyclodiphosphate synthase
LSVVAAILCAGRGVRFGGDKLAITIAGKPIWRWSYDAYASHPSIDRVILVGREDSLTELSGVGEAILGGETRQASALAALEAAGDAEYLVLHDGARPFVSTDLITRVVAAAKHDGAAAAALPVTDTIKEVREGVVSTLDRSRLWAMQTPQAARTDLLRRAHDASVSDATDDMALLEAIGVSPSLVTGDPQNIKITTPADVPRLGGGETRTGMGYDVHSFSTDPSRLLMLGGVAFPDHAALEGHSDADALLHAATDALLGAASLGDIGVHFPPTDERWRGEPSLNFVRHAATLLQEAGWTVVNLDMTVIAESPKVMKRSVEIRGVVAEALGIESERVSLKATTNERMGFVGRGEGIAALAVANIRR